jgi:long-chain acyl-CoA synthetase
VLSGEELSTQNDMLTPTLKLKRRNVLARYGRELDALYAEPKDRP